MMQFKHKPAEPSWITHKRPSRAVCHIVLEMDDKEIVPENIETLKCYSVFQHFVQLCHHRTKLHLNVCI